MSLRVARTAQFALGACYEMGGTFSGPYARAALMRMRRERSRRRRVRVNSS
jgi:hypothetical protein